MKEIEKDFPHHAACRVIICVTTFFNTNKVEVLQLDF